MEKLIKFMRFRSLTPQVPELLPIKMFQFYSAKIFYEGSLDGLVSGKISVRFLK